MESQRWSIAIFGSTDSPPAGAGRASRQVLADSGRRWGRCDDEQRSQPGCIGGQIVATIFGRALSGHAFFSGLWTRALRRRGGAWVGLGLGGWCSPTPAECNRAPVERQPRPDLSGARSAAEHPQARTAATRSSPRTRALGLGHIKFCGRFWSTSAGTSPAAAGEPALVAPARSRPRGTPSRLVRGRCLARRESLSSI
jgi:hypothetical protein